MEYTAYLVGKILVNLKLLMKNLLDQLVNAGLTSEQAEKTIQVVHEWLEEKYPMLGVLAKNTILKEKLTSEEKPETSA